MTQAQILLFLIFCSSQNQQKNSHCDLGKKREKTTKQQAPERIMKQASSAIASNAIYRDLRSSSLVCGSSRMVSHEPFRNAIHEWTQQLPA
jgi:hypothetical protein